MPRGCGEGRVYIDGTKLFAGEMGRAADELQAAIVGAVTKGDPELVRHAAEVGAAHGLTVAAISELSICAAGGGRVVVAMAFDASRTKGRLDEGIHAFLEAESGVPVALSHEHGVAVFTSTKDTLVLTESGILVGGMSKEDLASVVAAPDDADNGFGDAAQFVVWAKTSEDTPSATTFTVRLSSEGFVTRGVFPPPAWLRDDFEKDPNAGVAKLRARIDQVASKLPPEAARSMEPAIRSVEVSAEGNEIAVSMSLQPSLLAEAMRTLSKQSDALRKALAH